MRVYDTIMELFTEQGSNHIRLSPIDQDRQNRKSKTYFGRQPRDRYRMEMIFQENAE